MTRATGLIDMHVHLDLFDNFESMLARCEREQIRTIAVTTTPRAWPRNRDLTKDKRYIRPALGLHPELVEERGHEVKLLKRYLPEARYVGEVGLDGRRHNKASLPNQTRVLAEVFASCAELGNKILSVHSAGAATEVLNLIERYLVGSSCRVILHWFSGRPRELVRAINLDCYFSVNIQMLRSDAGCRLVEAIPSDRLLTETDGPFVRIGAELHYPWNVNIVVAELASQRHIEYSEIQANLLRNLSMVVTDPTS